MGNRTLHEFVAAFTSNSTCGRRLLAAGQVSGRDHALAGANACAYDRAAVFFVISALAVFVKNNFAPYRAWQQLRLAIDAVFAGLKYAAYIKGTASDKDLAVVHLVGISKLSRSLR